MTSLLNTVAARRVRGGVVDVSAGVGEVAGVVRGQMSLQEVLSPERLCTDGASKRALLGMISNMTDKMVSASVLDFADGALIKPRQTFGSRHFIQQVGGAVVLG